MGSVRRNWTYYFAIIAFLLCVSSLVIQHPLTLNQRMAGGEGIIGALVFYFSFFTILCNILVALCLLFEFASSKSAIGQFFSAPSTRTAVALYILVGALIYIVFLRSAWNPQGTQKILDLIQHYVMPALYLVFWFFAVKKGTLTWQNPPRWILFPALYAIYVLVRGEFTGLYPYPIFDPIQLGYPAALERRIFG